MTRRTQVAGVRLGRKRQPPPRAVGIGLLCGTFSSPRRHPELPPALRFGQCDPSCAHRTLTRVQLSAGWSRMHSPGLGLSK
jgi:hypothetical protein